MLGRNAFGKIKPGHGPDFGEFSHHAVDHSSHHFSCRPGQQHYCHPALPLPIGQIVQRPHRQQHQRNGAQKQRQQINAYPPGRTNRRKFCRYPLQETAFVFDRLITLQALYQGSTPCTYQVITSCVFAVAGISRCTDLCPCDHCIGHYQFSLAGVARHFFQCLRYLLAGQLAVQRKTGQLPQRLQRAADRFNHLVPVKLADQAKAVDDVADGQVGRHLRALPVSNHGLAVDTMQPDPVSQQRRRFAWLVRYALPQLG